MNGPRREDRNYKWSETIDFAILHHTLFSNLHHPILPAELEKLTVPRTVGTLASLLFVTWNRSLIYFKYELSS